MEDTKAQPQQAAKADAVESPGGGKAGVVVYVVELVQKLATQPTALVVLIVIGLYFVNRQDSQKRDHDTIAAITELHSALEKQGDRRAMEMDKAHQMFSAKQERQWEEVRKGNDIQSKVLGAVERLTDEVKRNKGAGGMP